jgi:hypothetical protein
MQHPNTMITTGASNVAIGKTQQSVNHNTAVGDTGIVNQG